MSFSLHLGPYLLQNRKYALTSVVATATVPKHIAQAGLGPSASTSKVEACTLTPANLVFEEFLSTAG